MLILRLFRSKINLFLLTLKFVLLFVVSFSGTSAMAGDIVYDADSYARMRIIVKFPNSSGLIDRRACPKRKFLSFDLKDLLKGDQNHSLAILVDAPNMAEPITVIPMTISVEKGGLFGGKKCKTAYHEVDFMTPLYHMDRYDTEDFKVTPKLTSTTTAPALIKDVFDNLIAGASILAPATAPAAGPAITTFNKLLDGQTIVDEGSLGADFKLAAGGTKSKEWVEKGSTKDRLPALRITARFEKVSTLFEKNAQSWLPSDILDKSFKVSKGAVDPDGTIESFFLAKSTHYKSFNDAKTLETIASHCGPLKTEITTSGFTRRDSAFILWAMAQKHPDMGGDAAIDGLDCMKDVFAHFEAASDSASMPKKRKKVEIIVKKPATIEKMQLAVLTNPSLAAFFKTPNWDTRRAGAARLFASGTKYESKLPILKQSNTTFENADQWFINDWNTNSPLANHFGCYLFRAGKNGGAAQLWAIGEFQSYSEDGSQSGSVEGFARFEFSQWSKEQKTQVNSIEITSDFVEEDLAILRSTHSRGCDGGQWLPKILSPQ